MIKLEAGINLQLCTNLTSMYKLLKSDDNLGEEPTRSKETKNKYKKIRAIQATKNVKR